MYCIDNNIHVHSKLNQMENSQKDKLFGCNLEFHVNFEFTNLQLSTVTQIKQTNKRSTQKTCSFSKKQLLFLFLLTITRPMEVVGGG